MGVRCKNFSERLYWLRLLSQEGFLVLCPLGDAAGSAQSFGQTVISGRLSIGFVVGRASARGLRILHGTTDEPDFGDRSLCERLQGIGAASQFSGQARSLYRTVPMYGRRSSGKGRRVDGDR